MTKIRKKKNYKLRRRVQRTIAAVTMITAIVVAAIPVENFGTMRAAEDGITPYDLNITDVTYDTKPSGGSYTAHYTNSYENSYPSTSTVKLQQVKNGTFTEIGTANKNGNDVMIADSSISGTSSLSELEINATEYYDYVRFDKDFTDAVAEYLRTNTDSQLILKYGDETPKPFSGKKVNITTNDADGNPVTTEYTMNAVTLTRLSTITPTDTVTFNYTVSASSNNMHQGYNKLNKTVRVSDIYKDCYNSEYQSQIDKINAYNAAIATSDGILSELDAKAIATLTIDDVNRWNSEVAKINSTLQTDYANAKTLQIASADFPSADNGLNGVVNYVIRETCESSVSSRPGNLTECTLDKISDTNTSQVYYIPRFNNGAGPSGFQLDGNHYLATGQVNVKGIGTEAFATKGTNISTGETEYNSKIPRISSLKLPSSLEFIGKNAFAGSNLTTVEIDTNALRIIGEGAFAESLSLQTLTLKEANTAVTIDKEAFRNTGISALTIPGNVVVIGVGAFSEIPVRNVTFSNTTRTRDLAIEAFAFYNCTGLSEVSFPESDKEYEIGYAAFALEKMGGSLRKFEFPKNNTDFAYSGTNLDGCDYIFTNRTTLEDVTMPNRLGTSIPDRIFAGCSGLKHLLFPDGAYNAGYDPNELFRDVYNTDFYVEGPQYGGDSSTRARTRTTTWEAVAGKSLDSLTNETGGAYYTYALSSVPYKFTDADGTVHFELGKRPDEALQTDPLGKPKYVATIDAIENTKNAVLSNYDCIENPNPNDRLSIEIPAKVSDYTVVEIGEGCFSGEDNKIQNCVYEVFIQDGSVQRINAGAFKEMSELQWIEIGDAVEFIGENAFLDCPKLENVVFSQNRTGGWGPDDETYWKELVIEKNAFKTNSEYLTFHGAINENYAPFQLAMSEDSSNMTSSRSKCQICYKTDAPLNLTVMRDRTTGKATLIDYPHYEEIDTVNAELIKARQEEVKDDPEHKNDWDNYRITNRFETVNGIAGKSNDNSDTLSAMDDAIVKQTLNMELPSGIQSIDSKAYFDNVADNSADFVYFNREYIKSGTNYNNTNAPGKPQTRDVNINSLHPMFSAAVGGTGTIGNPVYELYATYGGDLVKGTDPDTDTVAGLFSGYFRENVETKPSDGVDLNRPSNPNSKGDGFMWSTYNKHYYVENNERGNDYLTSINMESVEELPDFAFDSAENLKSIRLTSAMNKMGQQPFRDCKSLCQIDTSNSTKYEYENMILYDKTPEEGNGGYKIVQGLEGRGRADVTDGNYGSWSITAETNPLLAKVTDIADYAFANSEKIREVDLKASNIRNITQGAFANCSSLRKVSLPERTRSIGDFAFEGVDDFFEIDVPNKDCQISQKAFGESIPEDHTVIIHGIPYEDEATQEPSVTYDSYLEMKKNYGDQVTWKDLGSTYTLLFMDSEYEMIEAIPIESGGTLRNPPTAPIKTGYKFTTWICIDVKDEDGNPLRGEATYSNVTEDRTIIANYEPDPSTVVPDGSEYNLTVTGGKAMIGGTMVTTFPAKVQGGTAVTVMADDQNSFKVWTITPASYISLLLNPSSPATSFTMPNEDVVIAANTAIGGGDTPNPDGTYTVTVNNGTGGGNYKPGDTVSITANTPPTGQSFVNWTTTTAGVTFASATAATTTFVMPAANVTVTANFSGGGSNDPNDPNNPNNPDNPNNGTKYKLTVNYGSGSGEYAAGETVTISAYAPESSSRVFARWTTGTNGLGFANATAATTTLIMPASEATVTANYKTRTSDDDDDDDDDRPSRRPGTNTTTTTVPNTNNSGTNTNTTGTNTVTNPDDGNKIYITKNGVSNKDVASISVEGSTDNFIVRITESPEATAAVEEALRNQYGSLDNLVYFPMDISLYDSTGQNKITDTYGLNITVTMPIPDVLIQYGGNNRVAAADNGNLQQLTPRFTTIDGIACISFVPPHFSPYVIYVDTSNLVAGQTLDSTPSTGDPIHPKWFLAIGMACVSVILFVTSDGRKRRGFKAA